MLNNGCGRRRHGTLVLSGPLLRMTFAKAKSFENH